jgi:3-oxoacyl-[acyl-carrier-protein] synthase-1
LSAEVLLGPWIATPIGATTARTVASMRAGLTRFEDTDVPDDTGEPARASRLRTLDPSLSRTERAIALARLALAPVRAELAPLRARLFPPRDVRQSLPRDEPAAVRAGQVPLYLGLPEPGKMPPIDRAALVRVIEAEAGFDVGLSARFESGRAAFFEALAAARADLRAGRAGPIALVGGVDTVCDRESLEALSREGLLLGRTNPDGRIPGEAAGFVLLARPGVGVPGSGTLLACATMQEPSPFSSWKPSAADALGLVLRSLRLDPAAGARRVDHVASCQPSEAFWATELGYAYLRNAALMPEPMSASTAGEHLGDAGAGAGPVMLAEALLGAGSRAKAGARTLLYGSADGGRVSGCVVERRAGRAAR